MVRKVFHIEDSEVSRRYLKDLLRNVAPSVELVPLESAWEAVEALEHLTDSDLPELILADHGLPRIDGTQFVTWLRTHPRLRRIPVALVSAEADDQRKKKLKSLGVIQCLDKPLQAEQLSMVLHSVNGSVAVPGPSHEALLGFTEEAHEQILTCEAQIRQARSDGSPIRLEELKRHLHTLKGNAFTFQQSGLGEFVHDLEQFINKAEASSGAWGDEELTVLLESLGFAHELVLAIREDRPANLQRLDLMRAMNRYASGGSTTSAKTAKKTPDTTLKAEPSSRNSSAHAEQTAVIRDGLSTRIADRKLDELQQQLRRVLQAKNRLGSFQRLLSAEFPDERFPAELGNIHDELSQASFELMDFFQSLRAIPLVRLKDTVARILLEATEKLQIDVDFDLELDEFELIDPEVLARVEVAMVHLLRNAMDHGFIGRKQGNFLSISAKKTGPMGFEFRVCDNGHGINREALKERIIKTGVVSEKSLESMPEDRVLDLVFIDGVTTREEVSEFSGRGVGLGSVKAAIEGVGGSISVESQPGKGTVFIIRVPRWVSL
jgi:chemotaxis protein histidine kinase CheA